MSYQSPAYQIFNDYQLGLPISSSLVVAEHEGHLLAIPTHIFPGQQNLAYQWISQQNKAFNETPAAFVALNGLSGLVKIRNYLSNVCGANPFDFATLT